MACYVPEVVCLKPVKLSTMPLDVVVVHDQYFLVVDARVVVFKRVFEKVLAGREFLRREEFQAHPGIPLLVQRSPEYDLKTWPKRETRYMHSSRHEQKFGGTKTRNLRANATKQEGQAKMRGSTHSPRVSDVPLPSTYSSFVG